MLPGDLGACEDEPGENGKWEERAPFIVKCEGFLLHGRRFEGYMLGRFPCTSQAVLVREFCWCVAKYK